MGEVADILRRISCLEPSWVKAFARMIPFPKDTKDCNLFFVAFYGFFIFSNLLLIGRMCVIIVGK